tara:strand:- start:3774 stop:4460 length:687 start_codon:yes stop_codon:yes gene_type:complete
MTINVTCNSCGKAYSLQHSAAGKTFICEACGGHVQVPNSAPVPPTPPPSDTEDIKIDKIAGKKKRMPLPDVELGGLFTGKNILGIVNLALTLVIFVFLLFFQGRGIGRYDLSTPEQSLQSYYEMSKNLDGEALSQLEMLARVSRNGLTDEINVTSASNDDDGSRILFLVMKVNGISKYRVAIIARAGGGNTWVIKNILTSPASSTQIMNKDVRLAAENHLKRGATPGT